MGIKVFIERENIANIDEIVSWCSENRLHLVEYRSKHSTSDFSRGKVFGFDFYFNIEEDAAAFKLKWA